MYLLGNIFYDALTADESIVALCGTRIKSTCFEIPPEKEDNTPLPYILILDYGLVASQSTKDDEWMPSMMRVSAGVEIGADSPNDVWELQMKVMRAIATHIESLAAQGEDVPYLVEDFPQTEGVAWDWTKPCYHDIIHYQCDIDVTYDDED